MTVQDDARALLADGGEWESADYRKTAENIARAFLLTAQQRDAFEEAYHGLAHSGPLLNCPKCAAVSLGDGAT